MKSRLSILAVFVACLVVIGGIGVYRAGQVPDISGVAEVEPSLVRAVELQPQRYMLTETFYGLIRADVRVDMAFQVEGRVIGVGAEGADQIDENDQVKRGDVLVRVEPTVYRAQWEQATARVNEAKAAQASADAMLADAQAKLEDAVLEADRLRKLLASASSNQRELERAETTRKVAEAARQNAIAQQASAEAGYAAAQAELVLAAERLSFTTLKAPMAGRVARVDVEIGQMVAPSDQVMTLVDTRQVRLMLGVVERKVALLQVGQHVTVVIDALDAVARRTGETDSRESGAAFVGTVAIIPPASNEETGLFNVEVVIDNPDGVLRPGMVGQAKVDVMESDVVAVPADAVFRIGQSFYAYFVEENDAGEEGKGKLVARRRVIDPMAIDRDAYLLHELPGDHARLIVEGHMRLSDGHPVRLTDAGLDTDVNVNVNVDVNVDVNADRDERASEKNE